jgi:hypothetical protein
MDIGQALYVGHPVCYMSFKQYLSQYHVYLEKIALYLNCVGKLLSVIVSSSPSSTSSDIFLSRLG